MRERGSLAFAMKPPCKNDSHQLFYLSYLLLSPSGRVSEWSSAFSISCVCEDRNIQAEELSPMGLTADSITTHGIQFSKLRIHDIHFKAVLTHSSISDSCLLSPVPGRLPAAVEQKSETFMAAKVTLPRLEVSCRIMAWENTWWKIGYFIFSLGTRSGHIHRQNLPLHTAGISNKKWNL